MKRITKLMVFAGAMLAASCSENEIMEVKQNDQIFFRTEIARQTRATSTTVNTLGAFNITAWKDDPDPSNDAPIIQNAEFSRGNSDVYKASGNTQYYWPKGVDVKFYAYAPKAATGNGLTYSSAKRIDVEPLADTDSQVDLLYAANTGNKVQNAINGVTLNFRHTMAQIQVRVKNSKSDVNFNVTGWKIAGVDGSAYFEFDDASNTNDVASGSQNTFSRDMWSGNDDDHSVSYSKTFDAVNVTGVNSSWGTLTGSAILIPQDAAKATAYSGSDPLNNPLNGAYIAVQYQALDTDGGVMVDADTWGCWPVKFEWHPGFRYIYTIDLAEYGYKETGKDDLEPISDDLNVQFKFVDVEVDEWQPQDDEDANTNVSISTSSNTPYLRFHTVGGMQTFYLLTQGYGSGGSASPLEYSYDENATNWNPVLISDENSLNGIPFGDDGNENVDLLVRGEGFYNEITGGSPKLWNIAFGDEDQLVDCIGNIAALADYKHMAAPVSKDGQYAGLFMQCKALRTAPELPSETLTPMCYTSMFMGCENLINAPQLPATTMKQSCYSSMFSGCKSLETAPVLPATTLDAGCYTKMFEGCTNLVAVYYLPATTLSYNCYESMFEGCTSMTEAPLLPATEGAPYCYKNMFKNCSSLSSVTAYISWGLANLSGVIDNWLSGVNQNGIFRCKAFSGYDRSDYKLPSGWTLIEDMETGAYLRFQTEGTNLQTLYIKKLAGLGNPNDDSNLEYSLDGGGNWNKLKLTDDNKTCNGVTFGYNEGLKQDLLIRGNGFRNYLSDMQDMSNARIWCFAFKEDNVKVACSGNIGALYNYNDMSAAMTLSGQYAGLFAECEVLVSAPDLPAETLTNNCYLSMFSGCSSLVSAPVLPATSLTDGCYFGMFQGCSSLNSVKAMFLTNPASKCDGWLNGVSEHGCFVKNAAATWDDPDNDYIPEYWKVYSVTK